MTVDFTPTPLKSERLSAQVSATLRTAIFAGQLPPGHPLREAHLARDLGVSQATVREALGQLERVGLVVRTPHIGTHVTRLSEQDVRERVELRIVLEERAMLQAATRMGQDAFKLLDARLTVLTDATRRNDYFEEAQADLEFHRFIWTQSGNRTLYQTLDQIAVPLFAFVSIVRGARRDTLSEVVRSHEGIVQALKLGTPEAVREALRQHFDYDVSLPADAVGSGR